MSAAPQSDDRFVLPAWWGHVVWRARAAILIFALAALALTLPPQVHDMLADLADTVDGSAAAWAAAAKYHFTMILMAVGLWYWARAVLLAWHRVPDSTEGRRRFETALRAAGDADHVRALKAFDLVPRLLCFGTALVAALGTLRSEKWIQTFIVIVWAVALHLFLTYRMRLHLGRGQASVAPRPEGGSWPARLWHRLLELLDYAPFGRWVAAVSLALGVGLFFASAATAFIPHSIDWKTQFAHWLPGPSVALFLLGMAVAPLSAITYTVDRATRVLDLYVITIPLRYTPMLLILLVLMGVGAQITDLHALRVTADPSTPDKRASLAFLFQAWVARCAPGSGPVQPIIVAVSGGASRAGLWAAKVLDTVDDSVRRSGSKSASVFAVSSVSGGSFGAAAYVSMRAGLSRGGAAGCVLPDLGPKRAQRDAAEVSALSDDAIGPALAGAMLGDVPRALAVYVALPVTRLLASPGDDQIAHLRGNDRAEALEDAFEDNWGRDGIADIAKLQPTPVGLGDGYLALYYPAQGAPRGDVPLWIANGTDADAGDRLITVPFKLNQESFCRSTGAWYPRVPGSFDSSCKPALSQFWYAMGPFQYARDALALIRSDIPISTAIDNTSRFPFLSPSGELTPIKEPGPGEEKSPHHAHIIDGGYFENEGIESAMEMAHWLKAYGPGLLGGRAVYPIIVQATSDADKAKTERDIARCGNLLPYNPAVVGPTSRNSQFLVPLIGLTAVRSGHSRALLQQALEDFCDTGGEQAFFHFYLYDGQGFEVPLNWSLSDRVADYIWRGDAAGSMGQCGNQAELQNLDATLKAPAASWAPEKGTRRARPIMRCIRGKAPDKGKVVQGKVDALKLAGGGATN